MTDSIDFRVVLERRGNLFFWNYTFAGEAHKGNRGFPTIEEAATDADCHRRQVDMARHWQRQRNAERAERQSTSR